MGNDNSDDLNAAPAAPEGWYPHPGKPDLERFWDGLSWTLERPNGRMPAPTAAADLDALDAAEEPPADKLRVPHRKRNRWWIAIGSGTGVLVIAACVIAAVGGFGGHADSPPDAATQSRIDKALGVSDDADIPAGFKDLGNGLAYKWTTDDHPATCSFGPTCAFMEVYATEDCPSDVYVAVNNLDDSGTVVDDTNDSLPALQAGQKGDLEFDFTTGGGSKVQIASASCL